MIFHWYPRYCRKHRRNEFFDEDLRGLKSDTKVMIHLYDHPG